MKNDFDVLVVGAGVAGLSVLRRLHQRAPQLRTAVLTLAQPGEAGATPWAQGGVAVAWGRDDSPELHAQDTLAAGAGLCRPEAVKVLTSEGPERVRELLELGANFDRTPEGELQLTREAAHCRRRVVHAGDSSGRELARTLARALPGPVQVLQGQMSGLVLSGSRVAGVQLADGQVIRAAHVVLATGGVGQLFAATTNPAGSEGHALALAYEAGAVLRDLEFVQFHPTALAIAPASAVRSAANGNLPLLTEALRGEGALLVDETGERFMARYDAAMELAPRDVVAFALWQHRQQGHQTLLDARALPVRERFSQVYGLCKAAGLDPATDLLPVTPAVHYHMGGIEVDLWGRTAVPGLWACGECSSTGVHGANRLASNSLLEGLVFGHRVGEALADADFPTVPAVGTPRPARQDPLALARVRDILWTGMGLARSGQGLTKAQQALEKLRDRLEQSGSPNYVTANLMLQSAQFRQESRGAHRRLDFPQTSPAWASHTRLVPGQLPQTDAVPAVAGWISQSV